MKYTEVKYGSCMLEELMEALWKIDEGVSASSKFIGDLTWPLHLEVSTYFATIKVGSEVLWDSECQDREWIGDDEGEYEPLITCLQRRLCVYASELSELATAVDIIAKEDRDGRE